MQRNDRFLRAILCLVAIQIGNLAGDCRAEDDPQLTLAIEHLEELAPSQPEERRELIATLNDAEQSDLLRRTALKRLASTATDDQEVHDALIAFVESGYGDWHLRSEALGSLHQAGVPASRAVPVLIVALDDQQFRAGWNKTIYVTMTDITASHLAGYGAEAKAAIPKLLEHDQKNALGAIDPWQFPLYAHGEASVLPLAGVLVDDPDVEHRRTAANRLLYHRSIAQPATDALTKALADADEEVRVTSAATLVHLGDRTEALDTFLSAINSRDAERRLFVTKWLIHFDPPIKGTQETLRMLLEDDDAWVRWQAAQSLNLAEVYVAMLEDADTSTRIRAAREVIKTKSHDGEVFATLLEIVRTTEGSDRFHALATMKSLPEEIRAAGAPVFVTLLSDDSRGYGRATASYAARYLSNVKDPSPELRAQVEAAAKQWKKAKSPPAQVLKAWDGE